MNKKLLPFCLLILDGLALNPNKRANAFALAKTPVLDNLLANYPNCKLKTWGPYVGLPEGQMGNSEVGHLNIGAGKVVKQELTKINETINSNSLESNERIKDLFKSSQSNALHIIGLFSNGGVHSQLEHAISLIESAIKNNVKKIRIHLITDGRDRPQNAAIDELGKIIKNVENYRRNNIDIKIVSLIGRYFAMDRDNRAERTKKAYELMSSGSGALEENPILALNKSYENNVTDEFVEPVVFSKDKSDFINENDTLLFFNFRPDRMRQIVSSFLGERAEFKLFETRNLNYNIFTFTEYDENFPVKVIFAPDKVEEHLGTTIAKNGLRQLRIAETEKYPHVTYFFNGGIETPLKNEKRIVIQSPKDVATYDLKPEMSAYQVCDEIIKNIESNTADVFIINFANCDMVGHTGSLSAAIKAVETVDECLGRILECLDRHHGTAFITADHGNADQMIDYETGEPHTFHTMHPVPFIVYSNEDIKLSNDGALCDIAPSICKFLGLEIPKEMTGHSLLN